MKNILILYLAFFISSCSNNSKNNNSEIVEIENIDFIEEKKSDTIQEQNYIAIFDKKTESKSTLSENELKIVNKNLLKAVNGYNEKQKNNSDKINLRYYFRQYIISVNENGDKIVQVFCFCSVSGEFWRNEILRVHDGGDCYLNAEINLTKNKTEYFGTNGVA